MPDLFYNSDLQIRFSGLSAILQAMTSESTPIQQSWFVSELQWVTVRWNYCSNNIVRFSSMFEIKESYIVPFVNNASAELRLLLCTVCLGNK
jgi:hypothetical protein